MNPEPVPISSTRSSASRSSACNMTAFDGRLHHRFAVADRQRHVGERERAVARRHEILAPHGSEHVEHARIEHFPGSHLVLDHVLPCDLGVDRHGWSRRQKGQKHRHSTGRPQTTFAVARGAPKCRKSPRLRHASRGDDLARSGADCKRFDVSRQRAPDARDERASMRARATIARPRHCESPVASSSDSQSAKRARSSADSADSVRRADRAQLCAAEFADAPMRIDHRRERALRRAQHQARGLE